LFFCMPDQNLIFSEFGNKLRVRVCGLLVSNDKILMVNHKYPGKEGYFWSPPGGGLHFGEKLHDCLKREFDEETGLKVEVGDFLFLNEFLKPPLHAIELFFAINSFKGEIYTGIDPELAKEYQIITDVQLLSMEEIKKIHKEGVHAVFHDIKDIKELFKVNFRFKS